MTQIRGLSIVIVETGQNNLHDPTVANPLFFLENIIDLGRQSPRM